MKIFLMFFCLVTTFVNSQNINTHDSVHSVTLFEWVKTDSGDERTTLITIDNNGKVKFNGKLTNIKMDIQILTGDMLQLITAENLQRIAANNNPPPASQIPCKSQQTLSISIIFEKDYYDEEEFANKSQYIWKDVVNIKDSDYTFYKYLHNDCQIKLKNLLE